MLGEAERRAIRTLWARKLEQDAQRLPQSQRHRNLEPSSAEFVSALASGMGSQRLLDIGGSSGISTIALAAAARATAGRVLSVEIEPTRQEEAKRRIRELGLEEHVEFVLGDADSLLPNLKGFSFVLMDCEKEDYIRFFDMLDLVPGAVVVADNILSHELFEYVRHVRRSGLESVTLPIGKGLEVSRVP